MIILFWLFFCGVTAYIASSRGRSGAGFFFLSFFLSPLIGLVVVLLVPVNLKAVEQIKLEDGQSRKCPFCAELIKAEAAVCRYCSRDMPSSISGLPARRVIAAPPKRQAAPPASLVPPDRAQARELYLYLEGEQKGPFTRRDIQESWCRGDLADDSMYWKEGMPDWRPVLELI
jgi:hypothetical protein